MFCGKCGCNIPDGNSFCANCGTQISDSSVQEYGKYATQPVQPVQVIMVTRPNSANRPNGVAIVGLVFGIIAICLCWIPYLGVALGVVGLILSIIGICKIKDCGSGAGQSITGLILSVISLLVGVFMTLGMKAYLNTAQEAYESIIQESTNTNIETRTQRIGSIIFEVPSSWEYSESDGYQYYYPDNRATNTFMMVFYNETDVKSPTRDVFESFFRGVVDGFTNSDEVQTQRIISRDIEKKGNFYIGKIDVIASVQGENCEIVFYVVLDCQTGRCYAFSFMQPKTISDGNKAIFNRIFDSIELR